MIPGLFMAIGLQANSPAISRQLLDNFESQKVIVHKISTQQNTGIEWLAANKLLIDFEMNINNCTVDIAKHLFSINPDEAAETRIPKVEKLEARLSELGVLRKELYLARQYVNKHLKSSRKSS